MLNLRSFLYVNSHLLDDYLSAIDGYSYEEEIRLDRHNTVREGEIKGGLPVISGSGKVSSSSDSEVKKNVRITESAKFHRIYSYIKENGGLKYFEMMDENAWNDLERDDFFEALVTVRFSKIKKLINAAKELENIAQFIELFSDQPIIDKKAKVAIGGMKGLDKLTKEDEITCVFSFPNTNDYPIVSYLDKQYDAIP